ncbi:hypothetical protein GCM10009801_82040 [Streptomyces albiaxialis]|uniref:Uncharacterized protein n=1 Tax=Streptomyces albiaxialis TaxID=329523 RepID=A0ABN2X6E3_9ACTN
MSAAPVEPPAGQGQGYADPHRIEDEEGPQTVQELRAALGAVVPAHLPEFNAQLDAAVTAALDTDQVGRIREVMDEGRHIWALYSRPEVTAALADSLAGRAELQPFPQGRTA